MHYYDNSISAELKILRNSETIIYKMHKKKLYIWINDYTRMVNLPQIMYIYVIIFRQVMVNGRLPLNSPIDLGVVVATSHGLKLT